MLQDQARSLSRHGMKKHLRVLPMYAGLPYSEQLKVFERLPPTVRKVKVHLPFTPIMTSKNKSINNKESKWITFTMVF